MITEAQIVLLRDSWIKASHELGFTIVTPYTLEIDDGKKQDVFAFIPNYGSPKGMIIDLLVPLCETDKNIWKWAERQNVYCSFISIESFINYEKLKFKETLVDWDYFGEPANKPDWMIGFANPWI